MPSPLPPLPRAHRRAARANPEGKVAKDWASPQLMASHDAPLTRTLGAKSGRKLQPMCAQALSLLGPPAGVFGP